MSSTKFGYIIYIPLTSTNDNIPRIHHKIGYEITSQKTHRQYNFISNLKKCSSPYVLASLKPRASIKVFSL